MDLLAFFEKVESDPELKGIAVCTKNESEDSALIVEHLPSGYQTKLPFSSVEEGDWRDLRGVVAGQREPNVLYHMARIVGYYSRVQNWNRSKLGELRDRHQGTYQVV